MGWTSQCASLDPYAGQSINGVAAYKDRATPPGSSWDLLFADWVFVRRDGTVIQQLTAGRSGGALAQNPNTSFDPLFTATVEDVKAKDDTVVPAGGSRAARLTHFFAGDHLGTSQMEFSSGGYPVWQGQFAPYGEELDNLPTAANPQQTGNHYKFTGKERDAESGLDYFGARYYGSNMGRFMSPDPILSSSHEEDPQTWNKYAYARNNPLKYTDPTGLDFSLGCAQNNGTTCQGGNTYYQDAKGNYQQTLVSSDAKGNLSDQSGNSYTANVSGSGVTFSGNGSSNVAGTFVNGTNATTINGSGALSGFTFNFNYSDMKSGVNAGGTFSFNGTSDQTESALGKAGFTHYFGDNFDPFHLSTKTIAQPITEAQVPQVQELVRVTSLFMNHGCL